MECYKCGKETGSDSKPECDQCTNGFSATIDSSVGSQDWYEIDWDRVMTLDHFRTIMKCVGVVVREGSSHYAILKPFLKKKP